MKLNSILKKELINEITSLGGFIFYLLNLIILLILQLYDYFLFLLFGLFLILFISSIIRLVYFKNRPNKQKKGRYLITRIDASSFPSVHAQRITFLSLFYIKLVHNFLFTLLLLIITILVLYSRYYLKKHYKTDLIFGVVFSTIYFILLNLIFIFV